MVESRYNQLTSRNWAFIPEEIQEKLLNSCILLAGCGLGCNIGRDLAAMGFGNFIAIDGDVVEVSNLNRQAYTGNYIGWKKAEATADIIRGINPDAKVEVVNAYIDGLDEIRPLIEKSDFVLNTVDYHTSVFLTLTDYAQSLGKTIFFPTNVGYGSIVMVFDQSSISMSEYLGVPEGIVCDLSLFLKRVSQDYLPDHLKPLYQQLIGSGKPDMTTIPQVMPGAQLVSAMISTMVVKKLSGIELETCPTFYATDLWIGGDCFGGKD